MKKFRLFIAVLIVGIISISLTVTKKFDPQIGVCTSYKNMEMLSTVGYAYAEIGVSELLMPNESETRFQEVVDYVKTQKIPTYACNSFIPGNLKSVGPDAVHDSILRYAEIAFRRAKILGVKTIVFGSGASRKCPDDFSKEKATEQFVELLKKMSPIAAKYDVVISIEVLNSGETNLINRLSEGVAVAKKVNHPNCMILADIYHMTREGEGPEEIIKSKGYIYHCHIAENEGRTAPGVKGDDFKPYFKALKKIGYQGNISIECRWDDLSNQLPISLAEMKKQLANTN